jgi:hypothetical protein
VTARARVLAAVLLVLAFVVTRRDPAASADPEAALGFSFRNAAREAGLDALTVYGGREKNK